MLFPKRPRGNHGSKTSLRPPLEENKTKRQRVKTTVLRERRNITTGKEDGQQKKCVRKKRGRKADGSV